MRLIEQRLTNRDILNMYLEMVEKNDRSPCLKWSTRMFNQLYSALKGSGLNNIDHDAHTLFAKDEYIDKLFSLPKNELQKAFDAYMDSKFVYCEKEGNTISYVVDICKYNIMPYCNVRTKDIIYRDFFKDLSYMNVVTKNSPMIKKCKEKGLISDPDFPNILINWFNNRLKDIRKETIRPYDANIFRSLVIIIEECKEELTQENYIKILELFLQKGLCSFFIYFNEIPERIQRLMVRKNLYNIQYINHPSEAIKKWVINKNPEMKSFILMEL